MKYVSLGSAATLLFLLGWGHPARPTDPQSNKTPYAREAPLAVNQVRLISPAPARGGLAEFAVEFSATYQNPFDSEDVAVDARITQPSGKTLTVPGFLHRDFRRESKSGREVLSPDGEPDWRVRFTPLEAGVHRVQVSVRDRRGTAQSAPFQITVAESETPGFIRISSRDRRYFAFDDGRPYFPVGANVCWAYSKGTFDYDEWLPKYAAAGCNYARLWLSPHWTTFALEQPGKPEEGKGLGQFDLAKAWCIDHVLNLATEHGLRLMLCIDSFNILREKTGYPQWESTPHNAKNGGPLQRPTEFWTNAVMDRLYGNKLRYLVARYGWSPNVLSWEFWNEADITTGYQTAPAREWHARMAAALRKLDPYQHLITTSFAHTPGDPEVDRLPGMDYVQTHHYGSRDLVPTLARAQAQKSAYGKPHLIGEIGADAGGPRCNDDPRGYQIHDPIWISLVTGGAGTAQPWWWDNCIAPKNLYGVFTPAAKFVAAIDFPTENFQVVSARLEWLAAPEPAPRKDLVIGGGPTSWEKSEFNQPRRVRVTSTGASGELPIAGLQHGLGGHRDKHNPVTFEIDLPWAKRFEVEVGDVSGWGGANLRVTLNGKTALTKAFADPDGSKDTKTLTQYAGSYGIDLTAGSHTVVVENTGPDWFTVQYRIRDALEQTGPAALAWALAGKTTAMAWARHEDRSWHTLCVLKQNPGPVPASVLVVPGLSAGSWDVEIWDTWNGSVLRRQTVSVPPGGEARVSLEAFEHDVAVKLQRRN